MRLGSGIAIAIIMWNICFFASAAETLYEQPRIEITGSGAIGVSSTRPADTEGDYRSRTFDNFSLATNSEITSLTWVGAFSGEFNPDPDLQFRSNVDFGIEVFANSATSAPDLSNSLYSITLTGGKAGLDDSNAFVSSVVQGVQQQNGGQVISYSADVTPLNLDPGTYWLSIESRQDHPSGESFTDPDWLWVRGTGGDGTLFNFDEQFGDLFDPGMEFTAGCPSPCDTAFSLLGNSLSQAGDFDGSGLVEQADLDLVLLNWGKPVDPLPGGWINDLPTGLIDQSELDRVLLNWASGQAAPASLFAVPEPTGLGWGILVLATAGCATRLRRSQEVPA